MSAEKPSTSCDVIFNFFQLGQHSQCQYIIHDFWNQNHEKSETS